MTNKTTDSPEEITRRLAAFLREQEERDKWYWGAQHATFTKAIEQGRKNPKNCQKCGGEGFISIFRSYAVQTKPRDGVPPMTGKRWEWCLRPCSCQTMRARVAKEETMNKNEERAVFG